MSKNQQPIAPFTPPVMTSDVIDNAAALETAVISLAIVVELASDELANLAQRDPPPAAEQLASEWLFYLNLTQRALHRIEAAQRTHRAQLRSIVSAMAKLDDNSTA